MKNFLRIFALSWLLSAPAYAGSGTISVLDGGGVSRTYDVITDGSGNFVGKFGVCDQAAAAQCGAVKAASTAAGATDPALVVAISPNNSVAITAAALPLPAGAATAAGLTTINTTLNAPMQNSGGSVTANAGTNLNTSALALEAGNLATIVTDFGPPGATACTTDTASCNQNQQLQRLAQRLSTIVTTLGSPFQAGASIGNTTFAATQATSSNLKAQVDPLTPASWGIGAFAAAMPANGMGIGLFDGTNMVRAKGDETSGIWVNIKAGAGSGGTAIADKAAWTVSSTNATPMAGEFTTGGATACATAQACTVAMTTDRSIFVNLMDYAGSPISTSNPIPVVGTGILDTTAFSQPTTSGSGILGLVNTSARSGLANNTMSYISLDATAAARVNCIAGCGGSGGTASNFGSAFPTAGTALGLTNGTNMVAWSAASNYGTSPGAIAVPAVNAAITNTPAVTLASTTLTGTSAVSVASGGVASGGFASGAMVDLLTMRGTVAAGTAAANAMLTGAVFNTTAPTLTNGQQAATQVSNRGGALYGSQYPAGSTPVTASATGTTAATTATLATGASITTYLCGFSIRANATAAATGNSTVTGTVTGTLNFTQWTAPNASGIGVTEMVFNPCIPASAVNTGIAVISAAPGTSGVVSSTAWGYTL